MAEEFEIEDQRPDEEIVLIRHQHPWVLARAGIILIILVLISVGAFLLWGTAIISFLILAGVLIVIVCYGFMRLFLYRSSLFILTNHRVINILQSSVFKRKVQETELENIYNLQYRVDGMMQSLLNFGSIELTTEGDPSNTINVYNIENPHFVHEKISTLRKRAMNEIHR